MFITFSILSSSYPERYELNTSPAILFPSALVLNGRNTFTVENCKLSRYFCPYILNQTKQINSSLNYSSDLCLLLLFLLSCRPKVNYPAYNLLTVKDNQKSEFVFMLLKPETFKECPSSGICCGLDTSV